MIKSFICKKTEKFWTRRGNTADFRTFAKVAMRKLRMVHAALELSDLMSPPGNHLEPLKGDRLGQHSIKINDQYRICFVWNEGAEKVEITDYH